MNQIIRAALIIALCAALAALTLALARQTRAEQDQGDAPEQLRLETEHQRPPERYLANVATSEQGPVYTLERGKSRFRLITFLHLPEPEARDDYDPERRYTYGLEMLVRDARGELLHEEKVWFETRKSKAFSEGEALRDSSALYITPGEDGEPADQRLFDVDMERWAGPGHVLEVRALPAPGEPDQIEVDLVTFWRVRRSDERVAWRERTIELEERALIASRAGLESWSRLDEAELQRALRHTFVRQTSSVDTPMRQILSTSYRRAPLTEPSEGVLVAPDAPVVFNLEGPVNLRALKIGEGDARLQAEVMRFGEEPSWTITGVSVMGEKAEQLEGDGLSVESTASVVARLDEGQSATVALWPSSSPARMMFFVDRPEGVLGEHEPGRLSDGSVVVWPDRKKIRLFMLAEEPIHYTLRSELGATLGQGVMMTLRVTPGDDPVTVTYGFPELEFTREIVLDDVPDAPFERLVSTEQSELHVSEPRTFKVWLPEGARRLSLRSDRPGRVAASVSLRDLDEEGEVEYREPYEAQLFAETQRWRYAPLARAPWVTVAPQEARALLAAQRQVMLLAQVRRTWASGALDELALTASEPDVESVLARPGVPEEDEERKRFVAIEPTRAWREELVWERMPGVWLRSEDAIGRVRETWGEYDAIGFPPHHVWRCELPRVRRPAQRLEVQYSVPEIGGAMTLSYGNEPRRRQLIRTMSARETLWTRGWPDKGELELELFTPSGSPIDEIARTNCFPTTPDARLSHWRSRRVHGLTARHDVVVRVQAESETWNLNIMAYMDSPSAEIEVSIDGGEPERSMLVVPEFTRASRTLVLQAERGKRVPFVRAAHRSVYGPIRVGVPIGSDLAPGEHEVRIKWRGRKGERAWLRFFRME